jgi:ribonuclease-3
VFSYLLYKIRLFFHPKKGSYFALYRITGFFPHNIALYEEALLHKSFHAENTDGRYRNNERLEFLGDAVLNTIIADIVYKKFENRDEGFLTNTRSKIVKRESLDMISSELGLQNLLHSSTRSRYQKNHILGNALEAFIGAIYLDLGYRKTHQFIEKKIINSVVNLEVLAKKEVNFKSKLLEWSQKQKITLVFNLVENFTDYNNNPVFQSQVLLNGLLSGFGTGYSKKESQQQASQMALNKIKSDKEFLRKVVDSKMDETLSPT